MGTGSAWSVTESRGGITGVVGIVVEMRKKAMLKRKKKEKENGGGMSSSVDGHAKGAWRSECMTWQ